LIALLDEAGHRPVEAEQSITAISADYGVADALGLASGAPALKIHRIMRDAEGLPVQDITATYRADRFQYQMRLSRGSNPDWQDDI
jgi:GntR family transcriptional regulator